jgi:hypothetical protein
VAMCDYGDATSSMVCVTMAWSEDHGIACGAMMTRGEHHGEYLPS